MFLGIVGQVMVKNSQGKTWMFEAPTYPFLTGITVAIERGLITTFQFSVDSPYEEGIKLLDEVPGPFDVGNLIKARIGYSDMNLFTPWYKGMLNQGGEGLEVTPEGVSGTVSVQMLPEMSFYQEVQETTVSTSSAFPETQLAMAAEQIGLKPMILSGGADAIIEAGRGWIDSSMGVKPWAANGKNWWEVVKFICDKCGCKFWVGPNGAGEDCLFVDSISSVSSGLSMKEMSEKPARTFAMRGKFDPANNVWPILRWGPDPGLASWLGSTPNPIRAGGFAAGIDVSTGKTVIVEATPAEAPEAMVGESTASGAPVDKEIDKKKLGKVPVKGKARPEQTSMPIHPEKVGEDMAKRDLKNRGSEGNPALMVTIQTLGCPEEVPFRLINVVGCSSRYNGPYEVVGVTHTFSPNVFDTSIKALRHGTMFREGSKKDTTAGGQVPKQG